MSSELLDPEVKTLQTRETFVEVRNSPLGTVQVADELGFAYLEGDIDFGAVGKNEIYQNIKFIILTEYYSVPLDREFGMDYSMVDKPMRIAEAILAQEVAMKISLYEPRAQFREILYAEDMLNGKLSPSVKVALLTSNELPSTIEAVGTPAAAPLVFIEELDLPGFYATLIEMARTPGPMGSTGATGEAATIEVGTTTTGDPGTDAIVINVGDEHFAIFDFVIPKGEKGDEGQGINIKGTVANSGSLPTTGNQPGDMWIASDTGHGWTWDGDSWTDVGPIQGPPGPSNVLSVQSTTTGAPGSNANVTIAGTSPSQSLAFTIPRGDVGVQGTQGPSNVLAVNSTTTGAPGTNANVTISGVSPSQGLDFTIPRGDVGASGPTGSVGPTGPPGQIWRGTWNASTNYATNDAVEYQGSTFICTAPCQGIAPTPDTGSNWLPPLANTGSRGSLAALPSSNQTKYYARGDNTWQLLEDILPSGSIVQTRSFFIAGQPSSTAVNSTIYTMSAANSFAVGGPQTITPRYINSTFRVSFGINSLQNSVIGWVGAGIFKDAGAFAEAEGWGHIAVVGGGMPIVSADTFFQSGTTPFTVTVMITGNAAGTRTAHGGWFFVDELKA